MAGVEQGTLSKLRQCKHNKGRCSHECTMLLLCTVWRAAAYNCSPQQVTWLILSMCAGFLELSFWTSRVAGEHPEPAFCLFSVRHRCLYSPTSSLEVGQAHAYSWATLRISLHLMFWSHY